jgi:hypothetical protein
VQVAHFLDDRQGVLQAGNKVADHLLAVTHATTHDAIMSEQRLSKAVLVLPAHLLQAVMASMLSKCQPGRLFELLPVELCGALTETLVKAEAPLQGGAQAASSTSSSSAACRRLNIVVQPDDKPLVPGCITAPFSTYARQRQFAQLPTLPRQHHLGCEGLCTAAFALSYHTALESLDISHNHGDALSAAAFSHALMNWPRLRELSIDLMFLCRDKDADALAHGLSQLQHLTKLVAPASAATPAFVAAVAALTALRHLDVHEVLSPALAPALSGLIQLTYLNLEYNKSNDVLVPARELTDALAHCTALRCAVYMR